MRKSAGYGDSYSPGTRKAAGDETVVTSHPEAIRLAPGERFVSQGHRVAWTKRKTF